MIHTTTRLFGASLLILVAAGCEGGEGKKGSSRLDSGTHDVDGTCNEDNIPGVEFKIAEVSGTMTATLTWDDSNGDDLDLAFYDVQDGGDTVVVFASDGATPPGDSPATVTATVGGEEDLRVTVECWVGDGVEFEGTITVP